MPAIPRKACVLSVTLASLLAADLAAADFCPQTFLGVFNGRYYYQGQVCKDSRDGTASDARPHVIDKPCPDCTDPIMVPDDPCGALGTQAPHIDAQPGIARYVPRRPAPAGDVQDAGTFYIPGPDVSVHEVRSLGKFSADGKTHYFRLLRVVVRIAPGQAREFHFGQEVSLQDALLDENLPDPLDRPVAAKETPVVHKHAAVLRLDGQFLGVDPQDPAVREDFADRPFCVMLKK
jgi:hypothetical protein